MEKKTSVGATIIGLINMSVLGVFPLLNAFLVLAIGPKGRIIRATREFMIFFSISTWIVALIFIWSGYGLLKAKKVARDVTIYVSLALILIGLFKIINSFKFEIQNPINLYLGLYLVAVLIYLTRPKVKEQFK